MERSGVTSIRARSSAFGPVVFSYLMSSGSLACASVAQLVTFAILARSFGPTQFGLYVQYTAATTIAVQLCGLGASDCLIRRVSRDRDLYPTMLGHNVILVLITGGILVVGGTVATHFWLRFDPRPAVNLAVIVMLLTSSIVITRLVLLVETIFLSTSRVADANRSVVGFALARTAIAAIACIGFTTTSIAQWAVWQFCGFSVYALFCAAWLRGLGPPRWILLFDEIRPGVLYASQFAGRAVRQNVDLFVLGLLLPIEMIGSYGVARRIMDSSYLSIDAMNRLIYPRFARLSRGGLHHALSEAGRVLVAALLLGLVTALSLFVLAPYLPLLFGRDYHYLAFFLRCLSGTIIFVAAWSVAIDLIGASGRQGVRALIINSVNVLGSIAIAAATWASAPLGTFIALYAIEIATTAAAWLILLNLVQRGRAAAAVSIG